MRLELIQAKSHTGGYTFNLERVEHKLFIAIYWSLVSLAHFMTFTIF